MNPLDLLIDPLRAILDFLHESGNLTYGWAIVVLTVMVRLVLLPLVIKQYHSMRSMQQIAPELKALQQKHKGDRTKLNEEMMALYRERNVNPFASCLPLVAQLPIFIALFYVLRDFSNDAVAGSEPVDTLSFMWVIPDITKELTEIGWGAFVIVAIYGLSQLLSTELSATPNMPEAQRRIMRLLPIVIVLFVFQFPVPTGLVIYWMSTNLWTAGQQLVMRHRLGPPPVAVEQTNATGGKGSRTPGRLEPAGAAAVVADNGEGGRRWPWSGGRATSEAAPGGGERNDGPVAEPVEDDDSAAAEPAQSPAAAPSQAAPRQTPRNRRKTSSKGRRGPKKRRR